MSGLTRHRNAMHRPLNNCIQPLPMQVLDSESPPPNDMGFNVGEDNLAPYKPIQGDVQTLCHPILNGISSITCAFCFNFQPSFL